MRYLGPKARLCRRERVNLFGSTKYQKILQKRQNIPGMHGGKRMSKVSDFGKQLREKQKLKRIFGISEKQCKNTFLKASRSRGVAGENLLQLLERRIDNVIYRAGFAITRAQARQFVSHGLFLLNGRKVDIPSILVKIGDNIEIKPAKKSLSVFEKNKKIIEKYTPPSWLTADIKKFDIEIKELPAPDHCEQIVEPQMIVEFYSR